jgi:site-specific DNA recombinase
MLRNPAYSGTAVFGRTMAIHQPAGLNRVAGLQERSVPRRVKTVDRPGASGPRSPTRPS